MTPIRLLPVTLLLLLLPGFLAGQGADTANRFRASNVIRFNPTPMLVWGNLRNITFSYEHTVKADQSFAVQAGYLEFSPVFSDTLLQFSASESSARFGMNLAADYRFYPAKLNKFNAPRGLYLGGYISYYGFRTARDIEMLKSDPVRTGTLKMDFNYINLGFELGYQFIFWNHFAVDLLMFGPSFTATLNSLNYDGALTDADKQKILDRLKEVGKEEFPLLQGRLGLDGEKQSLDFRLFFRYAVMVGYRF